jgi:D-galactarolactone cycloisomerase
MDALDGHIPTGVVPRPGAALRVVAVDCFGLEAPVSAPFGFSQAWVHSRRTVLVRVETADGIEGWGEIFCQVPPAIYVSLVAELFGPLVLGTDPWDREVTWHRLYSATVDSGQRGLIVGALSGLDIALWDAVGKDCGRPVHQLLGGLARRTLPAYATGLYRVPGADWIEAISREARGYVEEGFPLVKMKVGFGIPTDVAAVRAVREAIGPDAGLAIDANHAYRPSQAVDLGRRLADYDITWFEEPVSPEDLRGYRQVRAGQPIPVAGGELAYTRFGFRELLEREAVDILQPDICLAGGFSEGKAIAELARAYNRSCWAHVWGTPVAQAAALHFLGWLPDQTALADVAPPMLEWDRTENPLREEVATNPPVVSGGEVAVPVLPGLGVDVDRRAISRYEVAHRRVTASGASSLPPQPATSG